MLQWPQYYDVILHPDVKAHAALSLLTKILSGLGVWGDKSAAD